MILKIYLKWAKKKIKKIRKQSCVGSERNKNKKKKAKTGDKIKAETYRYGRWIIVHNLPVGISTWRRVRVADVCVVNLKRSAHFWAGTKGKRHEDGLVGDASEGGNKQNVKYQRNWSHLFTT